MIHVRPLDSDIIATYADMHSIKRTAKAFKTTQTYISNILKANKVELFTVNKPHNKTLCFSCANGWAQGCKFIAAIDDGEENALIEIGAEYSSVAKDYVDARKNVRWVIMHRVKGCPDYVKGALPAIGVQM